MIIFHKFNKLLICVFVITFAFAEKSYCKEIYELQINKQIITAKDVELLTKTKKALQDYINNLKSIGQKEGREISYRTPLENLLNTMLTIIKPKENIKIIQEGRINTIIETKSHKIPDFIVYKETNGIKGLVGSVEAKDDYINLDKIVKSKQAETYSNFIPNLLLTNYRTFELTTVIDNKVTVIKEVSLLDKNFNSTLTDKEVASFVDLITSFYNSKIGYTVTRKDLAKLLATKTKLFKEQILHYCNNNKAAFCTKLHALHVEYNKLVSLQQPFSEFIESFSQSFIYGIIISKLGYEQKNDKLFILNDTSVNYLDDMSNEFASYYKVLYEFLDAGIDSRKIPKELYGLFTGIAQTFNLISFADILSNEKIGFNSLIVYLYEDYLKEYDNLTRKANGVYYTPKEVVDFIVKSTDIALEKELNLENGFLNKEVKVLDFATGTGSFLLSLYEHELNKTKSSNKLKDQLTKKILNDYYGFELMFAPYIVAHTNLRHNLQIDHIDIQENSLPIYLTNTLDLSPNSISDLLPELAGSYEASQDIKHNNNVIAIIGNPPYNAKSTNKGKGILALTNDYKKNLNEKKINLDDDYIKFFRFAEHKIEQAGYGVVGVITNNSFLDGVTIREMRKHLLQTFDDIYIINLHGNSNIKEGDKNVFDIRVGTAITILIKHKQNNSSTKAKKLANVFYYSTLDNNLIKREDKFKFLNNSTLQTIKWKKLELQKPYYFFVDKDFSNQEKYNSFWGLVNGKKFIFSLYGLGIKTGRDDFTVHYTKNSLEKLRADISKLTEEEIRIKYNLGKDSRDWKLKNAKEDLIDNYNPQEINYRPFDIRDTSLSKKSKLFMQFPDYKIMYHFDNKLNLGLLFTRNQVHNNFYHTFITNCIIDLHTISAQDYLAPLYMYPNTEGLALETVKKPNFTAEFTNFLNTLPFKPSPKDVLYYIYAVMYHQTYRDAYLEFLKIDFPKVPITTNKEEFYKFTNLGKQLTKLHLMEEIPTDHSIDYQGFINNKEAGLHSLIKQNFIIRKLSYNNNSLTIQGDYNNSIVFKGITQDIYNYQIGSYKVIDKWLKYRKADNVILTEEDINHIINMAIVIKNTINLQKAISKLSLPS